MARAGPPSSREEMLIEFLRRSYQAVDGLWFMAVEKVGGFDQALELDRQVWEVLAKIQARKARELTGCAGDSPADLAHCFSLKLAADGHQFEVTVLDGGVHVIIHECLWLVLLRRSGREQLASKISAVICPTEGRVWCAQFGGQYEFAMPRQACLGEAGCEMRFALKS